MSEPSAPKNIGTIRRFYLLIRSNWISSLGAAIAFLATIAGLTSTYLQFSGAGTWGGPYDAIVTFVVIPLIGLFGLLLIPAGLLLYRNRLRTRVAELADKPLHLARAVAGLTIINFGAIVIAGQQGMGFVSSNTFCGTVCHEAMQPEWVAFQDSPHANITCVDCHVGEGAAANVRAKLNGVHQLLGVIKDDYNRPVPVPVHQLRPASEICETCHSSERYLGARLVVRTHYRDDERNSGYTNVLLMRRGGTHPNGKATGIHWHINPNVEVDYVATDDARTEIPWVRSLREDGTETIFVTEGHDASPPEGEKRRMDCNDCHNRAGHAFDTPEYAVDSAIAHGLIPRQLPFVRKISVEVLRMERTRASAEAGIRESLSQRYQTEGLLNDETRPLIEQTAGQLTTIWKRNVFPDRGHLWDTYVDLNSHKGCFRCHDGKHKDPVSGRVLSNRCDDCHIVLSENEEDPVVLDTLGVGDGR